MTKAEVFASKLRYTDRYKEWRKEVLKEQGRVCSICGSSTKVQVHHNNKYFLHIVIDFLDQHSHLDVFRDTEELLNCADYYEDLWDTTNGQPLCFSCHELEHDVLFDDF